MSTTEKILEIMNSRQCGELITVGTKKCLGASWHSNVGVKIEKLAECIFWQNNAFFQKTKKLFFYKSDQWPKIHHVKSLKFYQIQPSHNRLLSMIDDCEKFASVRFQLYHPPCCQCSLHHLLLLVLGGGGQQRQHPHPQHGAQQRTPHLGEGRVMTRTLPCFLFIRSQSAVQSCR